MQDSSAPLRAEEGKMLIAGRRVARRLASIFVMGSLATGCATPKQLPPDMDGLVLQPASPGLDVVYLRPGTNFKAYGNIVLPPVQVVFDKDWDPNGSQRDVSRRLSEQDIQKMKDEMAGEFRSIFVKELEASGYQVAAQADPASLVTKASLIDVYINAPDTQAPGRAKTFTTESGRMTLLLDLHDGASGLLLGRIVDRTIADNFGQLEITNGVTNSADFRRAVADWAVRLRKGLDTLRSDAIRPRRE